MGIKEGWQFLEDMVDKALKVTTDPKKKATGKSLKKTISNHKNSIKNGDKK